MADPRISVVGERLKGVRRVIAVSGGKGGVGKSLFASILALVLAQKGFKVGLFDLDFTSPSTHMVLGAGDAKPKEGKTLIPARVHGLRYMSIVFFSGSCAAPLRGTDVSNALLELLSVVSWGRLDYLVLDMPPGIGDVTLDLVRLLGRVEFLIVTTSSVLALETVKKLVDLLQSLGVPVAGVVENMKMINSGIVKARAKELGLAFLGDIPFDEEVEESMGRPDRLLKTVFAGRVRLFASKVQEGGTR